jgi:hypothetical protein
MRTSSALAWKTWREGGARSSLAAHEASLTSESVSALIRRALPLIAGAPERIETVPVGGKGLRDAG